MPLIPGFLVALVTFPGVIVHEAAHFLFCRLRGVLIFDACFLRMGDPVGYVVHGPPKDFRSSFLISMGPFILNSLLCALICFPAYLPVEYFGVKHPLAYVLLWLGVSIGMHAFPSIQDVKALWPEARAEAKKGDLLAMVTLPLVAAVWAANFLRVFWIDYAYGMALGIWLPSLIFR